MVPPGERTRSMSSLRASSLNLASSAAPLTVSTARVRAAGSSSPRSRAVCKSMSISRYTYAGPLPETAVTMSISASRATSTTSPMAVMMSRALSRAASLTRAFAKSPDTPRRSSAGWLGITRTMASSPPSQASMSTLRIPAAIEMISGRACCTHAASSRQTPGSTCGLTARTRQSARAATALLSA